MTDLGRVPLIAGNWKMHKTVREAENLVRDLLASDVPLGRDVVVCPPFTALAAVGRMLDGSLIKLGGQDTHWETKGAFTGEVSPEMLRDTGCTYCIVGHSERRLHFGETDETVGRKVHSLLAWGITPIVCVGETLIEHGSGQTHEVVRGQTSRGLSQVDAADAPRLVIAYEPIWAIGTGRSDSPENANGTIGIIRDELVHLFGVNTARRIRLLYGGSVKASNIDDFMAQPEVDGALVGGASLEADSFGRIIRFVEPSTQKTPA